MTHISFHARATVLTVLLPAVLWTISAGPTFADQAADQADQPESTEVLSIVLSEIFPEDITCYDATDFCQQLVPYYMYADEPDSLLATLDFWENNCGSAEPIRRIRILASIWDGVFTEDLYDTRLIEDLAWRYDPDRERAQEDGEYDKLGENNVASVVDFFGYAPDFDNFTTDIADQLLPHTVTGSVEEFFCLFHSGRTDQAFALLRSSALEGTELHRRYHLVLSSLVAPSWRDFWGLTGSFWRPMSDLGRVGNHAGCGLFAGRQWPRWVSRFELSLRLGRAAEPYLVDTHEFIGMSDRYGGLNLMLETGPTLLRYGRVRLDLLAGGSIEGLSPFKDEEEIILTTFHGHLGAGIHVDLGSSEAWFLEVDWRREWITDPPEDGTYLGGDAWNARISLGFFLKSWSEGKLEKLGG